MSTVAVILAADPGSGFATPKYLVPIRGVALLDSVIADARTWPVDGIYVVLGADAEQVSETCDLEDVTILMDPEWNEGEAAPLRVVLDLLSRDRSIRRAVIARGDQPGVTADVVASLIDTAVETQSLAVVPKYRYAIGWPVVVGRGVWDVFLGLEGEVSIHDVLVSHSVDMSEVWVDQLAPTAYESAEQLPAAQ
ncbi:MAG: nucleotidyltransferase family protein [Acidimicrobiia bacterium]